MKFLSSIIIVIFILSVGCKSQREEDKSVSAREHAIIETLLKRDRNSVHVALWTLRQNKITDFESINFDDPYSKVKPKINEICESLKALPEARLRALDKSLTYHWKIYSPIYPPIYGDNDGHDWP